MAFKFTRLAYNCAFSARKLLIQNSTLVARNAKLKKFQPLFLAILAVPLVKNPIEEGQKTKPIEEEKKKAVTMTDIKVQIQQADELFDDNKFQEAVRLLKSLDQSNPEILWRLGRALFKVSGSESNNAKKSEHIREAYKLIAEALEKDDQSFASHKWYAILLDAKSNLDGVKERVTQLENVKKHMQRAIDLNPGDATSRYILGEFAFGLADLPWYQRKIVSTIFATPPTGTYEEALENFLKAEALSPDFYSMNKLMIGKCYYQLKENDKAKEFLTKGANVVVQNEDDRKCKEESESLLKKVK